MVFLIRKNMNIESFKINISDNDLADIITNYSLEDKIEDIAIKIEEDGVKLSGKINVMIKAVPFTAVVILEAQGSIVTAHLSELEAMGGLGNQFKGSLVKMVTNNLPEIVGLSNLEEGIQFNIEEYLKDKDLVADIDHLQISMNSGSLDIDLSGNVSFKK